MAAKNIYLVFNDEMGIGYATTDHKEARIVYGDELSGAVSRTGLEFETECPSDNRLIALDGKSLERQRPDEMEMGPVLQQMIPHIKRDGAVSALRSIAEKLDAAYGADNPASTMVRAEADRLDPKGGA